MGLNEFLTGNDARHRLYRTIVQGVLGVLAANLDLILGHTVFDAPTRAMLAALVMAVLSPVMAALGQPEGPEEVSGKHARAE